MSALFSKFVLVAIGATIYKRERDIMSKATAGIKTTSEVEICGDKNTWVKGEHRTSFSSEPLDDDGDVRLRTPHADRDISVKIFADSDGQHSFQIDEVTYTYLSGVFGASNYRSYDLLSTTMTLEQLEVVAETLNTFISGIKTGAVVAR
jgi:hypothetical protein